MTKPEKYTPEKVVIALKKCNGVRSRAAAQLGCSVQTIAIKIQQAKEKGLDVPPTKYRRGADCENMGMRGRSVTIADDFESLPPAPLYDKEPTLDDREPVSQIAVDPELVRNAGNTYGPRIDYHLGAQNFGAAHAVIEEAKRDSMGKGDTTPLLEMTLADLGIPTRICNTLDEGFEILRIGDLAHHHVAKIMSTPNFGTLSMDAVWHSVLKLAAERDQLREAAEYELKTLKEKR